MDGGVPHKVKNQRALAKRTIFKYRNEKWY